MTERESGATGGTVTTTVTSAAAPSTIDGLLVNYVVASPLDTFNVEFDCGGLGITQRTRTNDLYEIHCGQDFGAGHATQMTDTAGNFRVNKDMAGTIQYTFDSW